MAKRATKFYRKNESIVMNDLGLNATINSGAGWIQKEDGENDIFLCQLKSTDKESISIKQKDLRLLEEHSAISHKVPLFAFQFLNTNEIWVAIRKEEYEVFREFYERRNERKELPFLNDFKEKDNKIVDNDKTECYNVTEVIKQDIKKQYESRNARERFYEEVKESKNKAHMELKTKMKERRQKRG